MGKNFNFDELIEAAKKGMSDKLRDHIETLQIAGMLAQDKIEKRAADIKGDIVAAREQLRQMSEEREAKVNSRLLELQMNIEALAEAYEEQRKEKEKMVHDDYVKHLIDYATYCQSLADVLTKESQAALLEAEKETAEG